MATGFTVAAAVCRTAVTGLVAAAFACTVLAPDVSFVALEFLKVALVLQLVWNVPKLICDAAQLFFQVPPPPHGLLFTALVVADWVAMVLLLAAVSSATGALVFFQVDTRACAAWTSTSTLPLACSHWHGLSAALTLCAWFFSVVVSLLVFWLRVSPDPHQ